MLNGIRIVLVTGASGFCGTHLASRLRREEGLEIVGVARHRPIGARAKLWDGFVALDVRDRPAVDRVVREWSPDAIFHLAGWNASGADELRATVVDGTSNLLNAARHFAPEARILIAGSAAEYGEVRADELPITETHPCRPTGAYGVAKYAATLAALEHAERFGASVVITRPFNIVGPGVPRSLVVGAFIERLLAVARGGERMLRVGNLETERDFVAVEDVADAYVAIANGDYWGEVINLCSGRPRSIRSIVEMLIEISDTEVRIEVDPDLVRPADVPVSYGSWEKARRLFGFAPETSLEHALRLAWSEAASH